MDIVHAHNYHSLPAFFAALGVTDERFVVTTHYHGESAGRFRDRLLSLYRPFGKWAINQADQVIAVSEWERDRLREDFDISATVIPNGVEVERFASAKPESRDRPYILTVGRLEKYKGVQHIIRAMSELKEFDLLVVGSGPYREELERIALGEVGNRVEFLGYVADDRLPRLYAGAEVYVTLSEFEAYGMTVAEALSAGTPCVVRELRALADWAKIHGCFGVSGTTPGIVADAVRRVSETVPDRSRVPQWSDVTDQLEERYGSRSTVPTSPG